MPIKNIRVARRLRVRQRIRKRVHGTAERPRLSVYKGNKALYTQLINDDRGHTLAASSSRTLSTQPGTRIEKAREVGGALATQALAYGIREVVFDRSGYIYHGQVRAVAEGAREKGLQF